MIIMATNLVASVLLLMTFVVPALSVVGIHDGYTDAPPEYVPKCPAGSTVLMRPKDACDLFQVGVDIADIEMEPSRCLPHMTGLCFLEIERQLAEACAGVELLQEIQNVCCWYNKVDYYCCLDLPDNIDCPAYLSKTSIVRKPFNFPGDPNEPLRLGVPPGKLGLAQNAGNSQYRAKRDADTEEHPATSPAGSSTFVPRRSSWKAHVNKILKKIKVLN